MRLFFCEEEVKKENEIDNLNNKFIIISFMSVFKKDMFFCKIGRYVVG